MESESFEAWGSKFCLAYRQFNALCRKNVILKFRHWMLFLSELFFPIIFMVALLELKSLFDTFSGVSPRVLPTHLPTAVPSVRHLLNHTEYPNILCHDNNIFYRCYCETLLEKPYTLGWDLPGPTYDPAVVYWNNMHMIYQIGDFCFDLGETLEAEGFVESMTEGDDRRKLDTLAELGLSEEEVLLAYTALCSFGSGELYQIEDVHMAVLNLLKLAKAYDIGPAIAEDEIATKCEKQSFAIVPESDDATLNAIVSSFQMFIEEKYPQLADFVTTFASEDKLNDHITQDDYSVGSGGANN